MATEESAAWLLAVGRLTPEVGVVLLRALDAARETRYQRRRANEAVLPSADPAGTSRRRACDASRVVMRHDEDGRVVEVGARTRTIPPARRRALHHRDGSCRRHHRAVHEEGYQVAGWLGERLDVGWAIDVLHPLATRAVR